MPIGGTEVWHETLISALPDVGGFVCLSDELRQGDLSRLPCETGQGIAAARQLAESVDVLVVWGVGKELGRVLDGIERPGVISVSHCDHRSHWTAEFMHGQAPWTDECVFLCPTGIETVPFSHRDRATMIPNGVDIRRASSGLTKTEAKAKLGLGTDAWVMSTVCRLSPEKRVDVLVDAVEKLPSKCHLVVAGQPGGWSEDYGRDLKRRASDRVHFVGAVDSPGDIYAASDVALAAGEHEGFGLSTAEAMLAYVPVISTPVGFLEDNPSLARIVPLGADATTWATEIEADRRDRTVAVRRALAASQKIAIDYSVAAWARHWSGLIDAVACGNPHRDTRKGGGTP